MMAPRQILSTMRPLARSSPAPAAIRLSSQGSSVMRPDSTMRASGNTRPPQHDGPPLIRSTEAMSYPTRNHLTAIVMSAICRYTIPIQAGSSYHLVVVLQQLLTEVRLYSVEGSVRLTYQPTPPLRAVFRVFQPGRPMQVALPDSQLAGRGGLYATVIALLVLDGLNLLSFAGIAILGIVRGVSDPFPSWFRDGTDICFYLGLLLTLVSLPFLASSQQRAKAGLSAGLAFGTVMAIAFLTTRG